MSTLIGVFWPPSESDSSARPVEGVLNRSAEGTSLELDSERLFREFALIPSARDTWSRRVVGQLADGVFVSIEDCVYTGEKHYAMRRKSRIKFSVRGNVFLSNDEELVSPDEIRAHEVHVEILGLPEWFACELSHPRLSFPYATGIPLERQDRVQAKCDNSNFEVHLDHDFSLRVQNTLYWNSNGLFDLRVRQATVARIRARDLVKADLILDRVRPLVSLIRFLSGEDCVIRNAYLLRTDRALPNRYGGGPIWTNVLIPPQRRKLVGFGQMLFQWRDIVGYEQTLIRNWYRLYVDKIHALDVLDRVVGGRESVEGGIVLMVGAIQRLFPEIEGKWRYKNVLTKLGLKSWGIDVESVGKRISDLRGLAAHGRPMQPKEKIRYIHQFLVAALQVYFLRNMGFTEVQVHRMAKRQAGFRRALGLPADNLDARVHNEMVRPKWIMEGTGD